MLSERRLASETFMFIYVQRNCADAEIYLEPSRKSTMDQKRFIVDVRLGSKYISEMVDSEDKLKLVKIII